MENEKKPLQTEKQIIDKLFEEKKRYEQSSRDERKEIMDIYNVYMGKNENVKKLPYKSQESIPKMRTEIAYIKPFIFSGSPEIEIEGVGEEDKALSRILEKIVNYRISQCIPYAYEKIEQWVHQAVAFGTSEMDVIWKFETEMEEEEGQQYEKVIKDEPDFVVPNILDTFKNPMIPEVSGQHSIIRRSVLTIEEVKNNPIYNYKGEDGKLNREKVKSKANFQSNDYDSTRQLSTDIPNYQEATNGMVEIYERVTKERIQTVADGSEQLLLRDVENPYHCMTTVKLIHEPNCIPNRYSGLGVGQNTIGLDKMHYQLWNQTLDGVKLTNNPMFAFAEGVVPDKSQLVSKPGGGVSIKDTQGRDIRQVFTPILFPDIKQGAVSIMEKMEDEHKRASGANDLVQGAASNKTLGQDQIANTYSSSRFDLIQRRFMQALADVAEILIKMELTNLQSVNAPILRIFPQELRQPVYEMLVSEAKEVKYNIKVKAGSTVVKNKDVQIKQITDLFNLFGDILEPKYQVEWARKILELRGVDELDKLLPSEEEMKSMAEQAQMAPIDAQAMPQPGQGNPGVMQ